MTAIPASPAPDTEQPGIGIAGALRSLDFLDRQRVAAYALIILVAYLPMLASVWIEATGSAGSDFQAFWGAARILATGAPADVYNIAAEQAAQAATGNSQLIVYVNPPPYLFFIAPLSLLSYPAAWIAWVLAGWSAFFLVARRILPERSRAGDFAILAFPGAYLAASHAQNGFLTGAILIGAVLSLRRSQVLAGVLFGALVIKPHIALLVPFWLAAGRKWTAFAAAGVSAISLCLLSLLVFGFDVWAAYPDSFRASAALMAQEPGPFFLRMSTLFGSLRYHTDPTTALVVQGALTIATLIVACRFWRRAQDETAAGAMLLAATALASPYLFSYDLAFLVMPVAWIALQARGSRWRPWEKLALALLWLSPLITRSLALPMELNLMPIATAALVWMVWRRGQAPLPQVR